jgi:beta-galactosidase
LRARTRILSVVLVVVWLNAAVWSGAENNTPIRIDASQPYLDPGPARYDQGAARSPSGSTLGINSRYLTRNGKPWLPVMGEFHFSRYPQSQWEEEILKMKAAGVDIVATYVIWIHHEEIEGQYDWQRQRDLRAFVQICARHGLVVVARIGPWDHAEARNGGFPDWLLKRGPTRVNDPGYLLAVRGWFGQIAGQLKGLLWKDGGPVVGIQLENEYSQRGPGAGEEHILELKKIALESGLDVPLYFVTAWDNAVVPQRAVIPMYGGGYPDEPWNTSIAKLPPPEVYAFRFHSRVKAYTNSSAAPEAVGALQSAADPLPYFTAEIGGGTEDTYHRRPVIQSDDIAAMVPVMIGSGVNLYGTYMFQGGENPEGKLSTLQESQATGYPNDVPVKSYDFQAPLGEFGQERTSFRKLKVFQYFLNDFGDELAPMMVHAPDSVPGSPGDFSVPRASVRSRGDNGFIFLNNYVRGYPMGVRRAAQFEIRLPGGTLMVPRRPVDIPSGSYFIWPFNLGIDGMTIRYSTAQLFTRLPASTEIGGVVTLFFAAVPGIPVEFAFNAQDISAVRSSSGETVNGPGTIYVSGVKPGVESSIDLVASSGKTVRLVVLSAKEAENAWKVHIGGADHLLLTSQDFFADPDAQRARIWLRSRATAQFEFTMTPPLSGQPLASLPLTRTLATDRIAIFAAEAKARNLELHCRQIRAAGEAPPVKIGPAPDWRPHGVAQAPPETELAEAAAWAIDVPPGDLDALGKMDGLSELFLEINYRGDVARLYSAHRLLLDDFYNGEPWSIGLRRFLDVDSANTLELSILPLRKDAPIYIESPNHLDFAPNGQVSTLEGVSLVPEYQLVIDSGSR